MNSLSALFGLLPSACSLHIEQLVLTSETATVVLRTIAASAACPRCGQSSHRVHSRYQRKLADLPSNGKRVVIQLYARRFFCTTAVVPDRILIAVFPKLRLYGFRRVESWFPEFLKILENHGATGLGESPQPLWIVGMGLA